MSGSVIPFFASAGYTQDRFEQEYFSFTVGPNVGGTLALEYGQIGYGNSGYNYTAALNSVLTPDKTKTIVTGWSFDAGAGFLLSGSVVGPLGDEATGYAIINKGFSTPGAGFGFTYTWEVDWFKK